MNEKTALYLAHSADGRLLYVGIAKNWARRWAQHSERAAFFPETGRLEVRWLESRDAALREEARLIAELNPPHNVRGRTSSAGDRPAQKGNAEHKWVKSSGTTDTCAHCGCIRYWVDDRDRPSRNFGTHTTHARWVGGRWVGWTLEDTVDPPPCIFGRTVPAWIRASAEAM